MLDTVRTKKVFNLSLEEFKKGEWLKQIPESELIEVTYKRGFLSIHDASIKKVINTKAEKAKEE